ncbi:MAG TPA: septal ring lytic transglycosylase RlpA family protein [Steroidobacteraceae bacterium]
MSFTRTFAIPICTLAALGMAACGSSPPRPNPASTAIVVPPPAPAPAPAPGVASDAVPRAEPRSRNGNPPFYDVFGKRYYVLSSGVGYVERGVASWYGPGFHKVRTSTGELYDMYGMTAAHKTLPLPAYVRVTNLQNGLSVVVRVNDRGPFVDNRIIDLSYTAASRLDMLRNGTAMVEVRSIDVVSDGSVAPIVTAATLEPITEAPAAVSESVGGSTAALFVQAGAFSDPKNAQRLADKLRGGGYGTVFVRENEIAGRKMFRVRIGPVPDVAEFDRIVAALERAGIGDAHLALD